MKKLLLLALLLMACDNSTSSDTVEIDWILLKNPQMIGDNYEEITNSRIFNNINFKNALKQQLACKNPK